MEQTEVGLNPGKKERYVLLGLVGLTFALYFFTSGNYGIFRDELYYFACGEHLDFGYVDQPPLVAIIAAVIRPIFGDWLPGLRLPATLAISATVFFAGLIARRMGGGVFAQAVAALAVIISPVYQGMSNFFSMNAFDLLFWAAIIYTVLLVIQRQEPRMWLAIGLLAGLGVMNKYSVLFLMAALVVALPFTKLRKHLATPWPWIGGAIAVVIIAPNILWQHFHGWPFLAWQEAMTENNIAWITPLFFLKFQVLMMNPLAVFVWLGGLGALFFVPRLKPYRLFGIAWIIALALYMLKGSKIYYPAPSYLLLIPAGAIGIEMLAGLKRLGWIKPVVIVILVIGGLVVLPYGLPVLPVETFIEYDKVLKLEGTTIFEDGRPIALRQHYADRFGWEAMAAEVARVYHSLPPEEQRNTTLYGENYGNAGAIDFFRNKYDMPRAISRHMSYYFWGLGDSTGEILITSGRIGRGDLEQVFESVEEAGYVSHPYAIFYETDYPIYIARGIKGDIKTTWQELGINY